MNVKLILLTAMTMMAFAANSILCRLALVDPQNDPIGFTLVRLFSGTVVLVFFFLRLRKGEVPVSGQRQFLAPVLLFSYALFFSLSYVRISAGTGALILFGCVQFVMIAASLIKKQKMDRWQMTGVLLAVAGFVNLLLPGIHMPPLGAAALMAVAGISWGLYSLAGQGNANPVFATARNFVFTLPLLILIGIFLPVKLTPQGWTLAMLSGAITSGLGYVLWYSVLKELATTTAAIVQLSVPALAAFGGILFLGEEPHLRLLVSSLLIFSGIIIKVMSRA